MKRALFGLSVVSLLSATPALANELQLYSSFTNTDWTQASLGQMRDAGTGTLVLDGVSGTVTNAFLYWHGPTDSADPSVNAGVSFAGAAIVGTQIGFSSDNNWRALNSQAYRADVTSLVTGNGSFALAGFENPLAQVNGVSLVVTYDDGNTTNNRDVSFYDGNDSVLASAHDSAGWDLTVPVNGYTKGAAFLSFFVSDGQTFSDASLMVNGVVIAPSTAVFAGNTVPTGPGTSYDGSLWDVRSFEVTSFLSPGDNNLTVTTNLATDYFSLVALAVDAPAAPVPEPTTLAMMLAGLGLTGFAARRRTR